MKTEIKAYDYIPSRLILCKGTLTKIHLADSLAQNGVRFYYDPEANGK